MLRHISEIVKSLGGKMYGGYGMAFCPCHDNTDTPALSLKQDKQTDKLLVHCFVGCNHSEILRELNRMGLLDNERIFDIPQGFIKKPPTPKDINNADIQKYIQKLISQSQPIKDTIAEHYLRHIRKIPCELSDNLRFHPNLKHSPTGIYYPAMIGIVTDFKCSKAKALHRTYLNASGDKADITPNKMMLGNIRGGGVRLAYSRNKTLIVSEGIETALSLKQFHLNTNIVATLSTSGMKNMILPTVKGKMIIAIDNDSAGIFAGETLAQRAYADGWQVETVIPPKGQDFNDVLIQNNNNGILQ